MNTWVIYVNGKAFENYNLGKESGTWGIKNLNKNSEFKDIKSNDRIIFVFNLKTPKNLFPNPAPGFPRVKTTDYVRFEGVAEEITYGLITDSYYKSSQSLWKDDLYENRFNFKIESVESNALFTIGYRNHDFIKKTLLSFHNKGDAARLETDITIPTDAYLLPEYDSSAKEGHATYKITRRIERDSNLAKLKKIQFKQKHGSFFCEVCGFSFSKIYGNEFDYIECHHINPLSQSGETQTTLSDLILLCANCHRVVHSKSVSNKNGCMDIDQLKTLINSGV